MKKILRYAAAVTAAALLCGCTDIPMRREESAVSSDASEAEQTTHAEYEEVPPTEYPEDRTSVKLKLNAEGGVTDANIRTDGEFDGTGYIVLDEGMTLTHIADVPAAQHYSVALAVHSYGGAVISLNMHNERAGVYYVPASDSADYSLIAVDSLYMADGPMIMNFTCESGSAALDYIIVENSGKVPREYFRTAESPVSPNSTVAAIGTMKYLANCYGKDVITGQNVTPGTNAELDAIYNETGRYPAMRCGEIAPITLDGEEEKERMAEELRLAADWGGNGGIVSCTWHWYAPTGSRGVNVGAFDLAGTLSGQDLEGTALMGAEELDTLLANGYISEDLRLLAADIDRAAEFLKTLADEDIPVIWQPTPESDAGLYWWGSDAESFRKLWQFMFTRLCTYHSLKNLIWVWNGSSAEYYPGDDLCDIVGQSFFENSSASFAGRFSALARVSATETKALAITACDRLPKPDYMLRDNAMWLWFAIGSGDNIINSDGTLSERHTDWRSLHNAFNSEICVTLDELPDLREYAFSS